MNFQRKSLSFLQNWKKKKNRKPLILRGARQVGKTTLVNLFSTEFDNFLSFNLEKTADRILFEKPGTIKDIIDAGYLSKNITHKEGSTLIFIDEIQECSAAIALLRFFFEEHPDIFVIAAGSLLEFALKDVPSFPVGRVEYLNIHPLDFEEFLNANGQIAALAQLNKIPYATFAHTELLRLFHEYALVGGMPETVREYSEHKNIASVKNVYASLWQAYINDVEKYSRNPTERKIIRHIIETAPKEADRIKFERFGQSNYRSREVGEAFHALDVSQIVRLIYPTTCTEPPILTDLKKRPRLQLIDTGLLNYANNLHGEMLGIKDLNDFYRGKIIQHLVTQQLISLYESPIYKPHFWVREKSDSCAEVDLIFHHEKYLIPVEIKSGPQGKLRSLHQFMLRCNHPYAIRLWAGDLSVSNATTPEGQKFLLLNLPYFLAVKLPEYASWFVQKTE